MAGRYKRSKISLDEEMDLVIGCIVDTKFLRDFKILIGEDLRLMKSKYLRIITTWTFEYYDRYNKAPFESIMQIYKAKASEMGDDDEIDLIESALTNINSKYIEDKNRFDCDLIFAQTTKYIRGISLDSTADRVKGFVAQGKVQEAEKEFKGFVRKEINNTTGIEAFGDMNAIADMFKFEKSVIDIPGALGELLQEIYKGDLVFPSALSKRGKTWFLIQLALWSAQQGLSVAFFTFEMNSKLINRRLAQTLMGKSFKAVKDKKYVPSFDSNNNIVYKKKKIGQLTEKDVKRSYRLMNRQCGKGGIWFYDSTTSGRTVDAIKNTIINSSTYDDRDYDLIIIDQLSLIQGKTGIPKRLILDDIAIRLKTEICEEMQLPVVTPLQYNARAATNHQGGQFTLNEASSLFHHASLLINLNSSDSEKERGIMRVSASGRHNNYDGECVILQNLDMGKYVIDSRWKRDIPNMKDVLCENEYNEEDEKELEEI